MSVLHVSNMFTGVLFIVLENAIFLINSGNRVLYKHATPFRGDGSRKEITEYIRIKHAATKGNRVIFPLPRTCVIFDNANCKYRIHCYLITIKLGGINL